MIKVKDLYEIKNDYLKPLFNCTYPWEILPKINEYILTLISSPPSGFTLASEGVLVGENVEIDKGATIIPPVVIGHGTKIRTGAFLRGNVITGKNCVIGNSSEIKNSILLNNAQVPHYNYVGDSILGNYAHMGAGSILSNLKLGGKCVIIHADIDYETNLRKIGAFLGDYADIGCNCVLNPGTIVGKSTCIYPLNSIRGVIPEKVIVKSQENIVAKR
jgi:NDP-sugar pyrophosphorylase family protein